MPEIKIDNQGRLALPGPVVRRLGRTSFSVDSASAGHCLLVAADGEEAPVLCGRLGDLSVADYLSFLNMFRRTGVLHLELPGGRKSLFFQQGEIVFATSSFAEDDLVATLHGLGRLEGAALEKARRFIGDPARLGKFLVDRGLVSAKDLWLAARSQVEGIVYRLFENHRGSCYFVSRSLEGEEILRLSLSTQNLIMEGVRRVDERQFFMRRIGSLENVVCPVQGGEAPLSGSEQRLLDLLGEGGMRARELVRRGGIGEYESLRLLHQLLEKGRIRLEEAVGPTAVVGRLGEVLEICNGALAILHRRVGERYPGFAAEVNRFLRDLPRPHSYLFRDVTLAPDGTIEGALLQANLVGLQERDQLGLAADALNELLYMECVIARRELGAAESTDLTRRVQEIAQRVSRIGTSPEGNLGDG